MIYVKASGSFYHVGYQVGFACKRKIPDVYKRMVDYLLEHTSVGTEEKMHEVAQRHLVAAEKYFSPSVEFLRGMAKGADVSIGVIATLSFSEEVCSEFLPTDHDKCSTLVVRLPNGKRIILHNEDYQPYNFGNMVLLEVVFDGFPKLICLTYMGMLPSLAGSLNACGIAITNNGLWPEAQPGVPKQVVHFRASLAYTIADAEEWLTLLPNSVTTHYVVSDGQETISLGVSNLKTAHADTALRRITGPVFCHTNHIPKEDEYFRLLKPDPVEKEETAQHTFARYERLKNLTPEELPQTPQQALDFFSTNDGLIHRTPQQHPTSVTLATVVICAETKEFWLRDSDPAAVQRDWYFCLRS